MKTIFKLSLKKFRMSEYCCVPGCSNQYADDKIRGIKRSYYKFLDRTVCKNATLAAIKLEQKGCSRRDNWNIRNWDSTCFDHLVGGTL